MEDAIIALTIMPIVFIVFPIILFHYITKWKTAKTLTGADEKLLDELYALSRRLDDRMCTIERIMSADNPNWKQSCTGPELRAELPPPSDASIEAELAEVRRRLYADRDR